MAFMLASCSSMLATSITMIGLLTVSKDSAQHVRTMMPLMMTKRKHYSSTRHLLKKGLEGRVCVGLEFIHPTSDYLWHLEVSNRFLLQRRSNLTNSISYFGVAICDFA